MAQSRSERWSPMSVTSCPNTTDGQALTSGPSLPDLTPRINEAGLLADYIKYRDRYLAWRQGATVPPGEITDLGSPSHRISVHEAWVPRAVRFSFFSTAPYWVAMWGMIGSILLFFGFSSPLLGRKTLPNRFVAISTGMGNLALTLCFYLAYLDVINVSDEGGGESPSRFYVWPKGTVAKEGISKESMVGSVAYFVGMLFWDFGFAMNLVYEPPPATSTLRWVSLDLAPNIFAGLLFVVGGIAAVRRNRNRAFTNLAHVISCLQCFSDICFSCWTLLACVLEPSRPLSDLAPVSISLGCLAFYTCNLLSLKMWRSNDTDLLLLRRLHDTLETTGQVDVSARGGGLHLNTIASVGSMPGRSGLSKRGVAFLVLHAWLASMCLLNLATSFCWIEGEGLHVLDVLTYSMWLSMSLMVLALHSAVVYVPDQQPYRCAMLFSRLTVILACAFQTLVFVEFYFGVASLHIHER